MDKSTTDIHLATWMVETEGRFGRVQAPICAIIIYGLHRGGHWPSAVVHESAARAEK
jgi:hypothetical protein